MVQVKSSSSDKMYDVTETSCSCPDYVFRQRKAGGQCKHMIKLFFNVDKPTDEFKEFFRQGADIDESYDKFGDDMIDNWLRTGEICKHQGKFVLLE